MVGTDVELVLNEGQTVYITRGTLEIGDYLERENVLYTVTILPTDGTLLKANEPMSIGDTFTQACNIFFLLFCQLLHPGTALFRVCLANGSAPRTPCGCTKLFHVVLLGDVKPPLLQLW